MRRRFWNEPIAGVTLALAIVAAGCGERKQAATTGDTASTGAVSATDTAANAPAAPASGALTDANIVALLDEANKADSSAGAAAVAKATSPGVKQFAKLMMSEHHELRQAGQELAKKVNLTPEPPANDPLAPLAQQEMSALESTPKGPQFDRAYIDQEVAVHKAVKDLLGQAKNAAQNDQLKNLISKAEPVIQKHLDQAEALQKKLGTTT
jgi:putative membrane protein